VSVAPRQWIVENLPTLPRFAQPDAEFQARRPAELAQINAARRVNAKSDGWRQAFIWPARGRISGVFGSQRIYRGEPGAPHSGVDVAGATGTPVVAPADGVVVLAAASPFTLEGNLLMIDHGMGLNSAFLHLSRIDVKAGDVVRQGQPVGAIGMTGRATGPHLHWGMKWNDERIDAATLAGPMR
jgi:murein DD-endopeptidase MepM/ murein hydrolase activator NlpD